MTIPVRYLLTAIMLLAAGCSMLTSGQDTSVRNVALAVSTREPSVLTITAMRLLSPGDALQTGEIAARAHLDRQNVVIEFGPSLPAEAHQIAVSSRVPLNPKTNQCFLNAGTYELNRGQSTAPKNAGTVTIPATENSAVAKPRKRRRCVDCCSYPQ